MTDAGVARSRVRKVSAQEERDTTVFRRGEGKRGDGSEILKFWD